MGMGFSLKKIVAGVTFQTTLLTALAGCSLPEMNEETPLERASSEKMRDALLSELQGVDLTALKVGQGVFYEDNYRAEQGPVIKIRDLQRTVANKEDQGSSFRILLREIARLFKSDGTVEDEKTSDVIWNLEKGAGFFALARPNFNILTNTPPAPNRVEYYNLKTLRRTAPLPANVVSRPNCGGFSPCELDVLDISYLVHVIENDVIVRKIQYRGQLSARIPAVFWDENNGYLPVLNECITYTLDNILVNRCLVMRDAVVSN
jgi:hypothetical protein